MAGEAQRDQDYLETVARLEPEISMVDHDAALTSIAVSLKRIADALEQPLLAERIESAINTGMWYGAQAAIGAWIRK